MEKELQKDKLITLPESSLMVLTALAKGERMTVKPYLEKVLIQHANQSLVDYATKGMKKK